LDKQPLERISAASENLLAVLAEKGNAVISNAQLNPSALKEVISAAGY
jgi:hypothetical protein